MDITVVIPTWNRPALLERCLESLMRQTFPADRFEVLVVSDGPDLRSEIVIQAFQNRPGPSVRGCQLPEKRGPAAARNVGWENGRGKLIAFTDDDCIADSTWLEQLWKTFTNSEDVVAFAGRIVVPVDQDPTDYQLNIRHLEDAEFVTANCACSRIALQITGGFDEQFSMAWREDSDLHFKLITAGIPILPVREAVVIHPVREARWGVSLREQRKAMFNALLYKKFPDLYRKKIDRGAPALYYVIVILFFLGVIAIFSGLQGLSALFFASWFLLTLVFAGKRLIHTSKSVRHVLEMTATSFPIPFLSLYWRFYGAIQFRTPFF